MNEIEELYQLLQGKVKTGTLEEFTQRMQNPKSLAAVKKYAQEKIKPNTNLEKFNEGFEVKSAAQVADQAPVQEQVSPAKVGVQAPKTGTLRLPEEDVTQAPQMKITGFEGLKPSELSAVQSRKEAEITNYKSEIDDLDKTLVERYKDQPVNPADPDVIRREQVAEGFNKLLPEYEKLVVEQQQRQEPIKTVNYDTTPLGSAAPTRATQEEKFNILKGTFEDKRPVWVKETEAKALGYTDSEEKSRYEQAGVDKWKEQAEPEQVGRLEQFVQTQFGDLPQNIASDLGGYLNNLALQDKYTFDRTVNVEDQLTESMKFGLIEKAYDTKMRSINDELFKLSAEVSADNPQEYSLFLSAVSTIEQSKDPQQIEAAYDQLGSIQDGRLKKYYELYQDYTRSFNTVKEAVKLYPEVLAKRAIASWKNDQIKIQPTDSKLQAAAKQMMAVRGATQNTASRLAYKLLKTLGTADERVAKAFSGKENLTSQEITAYRLGEFFEANMLPELDGESSKLVTVDKLGKVRVNKEAVLPSIASGVVNMAAIVYGAQALGAPAMLNSSSAGLVTSGFLMEFDDIYESALKTEGVSSRGALAFATAAAFLKAQLERVSPMGAAQGIFDKTVKSSLNKLSKELSGDFASSFARATDFFVKQPGLEMLQEFTQDGSEALLGYVVNQSFGTKLNEQYETPEMLETAMITYGTTLAFSAFSGKGIRMGEAYEAAKFLAEKPEALEAELQRRVSLGRMDAEQAREFYQTVLDVKTREDAAKAKETFDKKIEGYVQDKPVLEDYEGPIEIEAAEYFALDAKVPSGVIVNWDGKKYEVRTDDKGTTLILMEEVEAEPVPDTEYNEFVDKGTVSEQRLDAIAYKIKTGSNLTDREKAIFTANTDVINERLQEVPDDLDAEYNRLVDIVNKQDRRLGDAPTPEEQQLMSLREQMDKRTELKPIKQKLTVEEFNELVQAPRGERIETELENAQVVEYQGKEYRVISTDGETVTIAPFSDKTVIEKAPGEKTPQKNWKQQFAGSQNKSKVLQDVVQTSGNSNELQDVYEKALTLHPTEASAVFQDLANNLNTPQEVFDEMLNSGQLEGLLTENDILTLIDQRTQNSSQLVVPAANVKAFTVVPKAVVDVEGQKLTADQKQQQALQLIDQVEQDQIEKINSSNLTDVQKKSQTKAIQEALKRSRKEILGVKEELKTGQAVYFGGKQVKIKSLTKNTAKVEMGGVVTTVPRSSLSLSDTAPLDTLAQELKDEAQVKGHVYTIDSAKLSLSAEDNRAYLKADTHTANIVGKVKKLLPTLAKSGIKINVYSDPLSAKEAALKAGADPRGVESRFYEGKEVVSELYQGEGLTEVTFEDGTTEIVKTDDIQTSSFGGYFDAKTKTILINAQVAGAATVEHEFLHPVIESILIDNPEIVTTFFEQIKKMPEWADLKDFVEQYDAREQPIEALIEFTARIISPEFKYQTRRPTFKRAVVDFFRRIFRIAGPIVNINSKNVLDFAESLKKSFELGRTFDIKDTIGGFSKANQFSRSALTIPEMELSFDKFRDLALLWKAYNPTKSEADFYEYVRTNVDKRVNKGFMSAAFNDDATYLQKRKDAELDTRSKNLNAQSRGTLGYMADPNVPQFIKDRLKTEQLRYETEPNSVTEKTVDYIIQNYDLSNAEAVLESIQVPAVRTRLADKLVDRLNKLGRDAATAEEKTEYYYAALKLTENNIHYLRSLGRGIQIHSMYSKMDKEGVAFAVNQMMKINRSGLKKAHKTAIDRMVAYARLVERGQRNALITEEVKTQVLSGGKTREQVRNLKESAAKKLRAIGAQGFSVAPDRQSLLDYGYYEFLDGRRNKASWVKHMTDRGLSDAADVYDYHNFGTEQKPEALADFSNRVESLSDLIGTPALAQAIGQPLADKINAEHRKRVVSALRDKYKKDLKKKGIAGQMAAALITAVEKGQYDSDVLLDELAKTVGAVELTQDDIKIIDEIYKRAETYPEGRIRDEELAKAWDYIYARSGASLKYGEIYWSFYYANILSGPGTHALNLIENALNIILEPTVQIADQITRVNTQGLSRRTVAWNMASGVLRGLFGAGVREGLSVVVTGKEKFRGANKYFDSNALEQIAKGTAGRNLITTLARPAATVMRYIPRVLAAADAFYNQAHFEMGSATVAAQIVRQEVDTKVIEKKDAKARYYEILGDSSWWVTALRDAEIEIKEAYRLQGKELTNDFDTWYKIKTRAREIVLNKRQEAASKYVYNDIGGASSDMAAIGTYTNAPRGVLGAVATHMAGLVKDVPIARHVIPFVNIVANVYNRQLDYTPWGLARAAAITTRGGKSDFIAEGREKYSWNTHEGAAKQHIIKSVMGTAAMIAAYLLFWDDDDNVFTDCDAFTIHGRGPTDYAKKKEMEARGWKPYSFQYKCKFYAFNWTPFNLALSYMANAIDNARYGKANDDKTALDNVLIQFNLLGSTLLSAAFVKSAADFLSFFQEGKEESDRLWKFLGRTAISSVPAPMALFNAIHSTVDNTKYQADSVSQGILRNIPIAKTQLKPALNAFGEVITKTGISQDMTWYRVGELTGLNRFMSALDTNDTTFAWLHQNGLWPPVIGKTKELFGNKVSDETHYKLVEICGPNIKRMIEFDKAYIDKLIVEDGVAEANKYINQKLKDRIVDFVEDAIIDQYNFKPDEETIIELKDVDWEKVRKYVTDATNEMMVPVE